MYSRKVKKGYVLYENEKGPGIGTAEDKVLVVEGCVFKDLAGTGELLPYEDWRLPYEARAKDLAARLPVEMIAGLMLYSSHQMVPGLPGSPFPGTYKGTDFPDSGCDPWEMSDEQKKFLKEDHIRHVLVSTYQDTETAVRWQNSVQAYAEALPFGIPVNFSSDPRHGAADSEAEYKSGAGEVSKWPEGIGMAALFDPESLKGLIALQWQEAATYLYLSRRLGGREGTQLHNLFTQCQSHTACLKGIYTLATGKHYSAKSLPPQEEPVEVTLRRCYGNKMRCLAEYEARGADPEYGQVFLRLAQQEREVCSQILEIIGRLTHKV